MLAQGRSSPLFRSLRSLRSLSTFFPRFPPSSSSAAAAAAAAADHHFLLFHYFPSQNYYRLVRTHPPLTSPTRPDSGSRIALTLSPHHPRSSLPLLVLLPPPPSPPVDARSPPRNFDRHKRPLVKACFPLPPSPPRRSSGSFQHSSSSQLPSLKRISLRSSRRYRPSRC